MNDVQSVWEALGGDPALVPRVSTVAHRETLDARLPVRELARACVAACALAAAELGARRAGLAEVPAVRVDDAAVAAAFHSERLLGALGLPEDASVERVAAVLAERTAADVEERVYDAGGLAVALRTPAQWAAHEQAAEVARRPLVERATAGAARARVLPPVAASPLLPAAGLRVLDLTRVIAGPVGTRTLALLGADVLRIDPPWLPELADQHADTDFGKRSATLDLRTDRETFEELLAGADVVVTGYRPGSLDRFGLTPSAAAEQWPGLVVAQVSAWGTYGPWGGRRGFDSLVQAATGIAVTEGSDGRPGALPAQALDHGTGYLLAAAVLRALTERTYDGRGRSARLALARTAAWLTHGIGRDPAPDDAAAGTAGEGTAPRLAERDSPLGHLRYAPPAVSFTGGPTDWARPPGRWGADEPRWD
ncbi:CoA transferase [Streptomyces sp. MMS24-I2-30]|uniref:CoA transferase n=1 Tax=Streptomyces sp. MMS24-I2-30 TaxID=3351564 RepID=UPI003896C567